MISAADKAVDIVEGCAVVEDTVIAECMMDVAVTICQ